MTQPATDPEFLSPEGERAWTWMRRHLDRANAFWLAFVLTDDLTAQRVLRERMRANRRMRAQPLAILQPATPAELGSLLDDLEQRGAAPPGCTWVAAPQLADDEWLAAWHTFLLAMNHRRDVLRARLGGLVIAAPPAVKLVAQRESPDLWSVRDLLIELGARPATSDRAAVPREASEPRQVYGAQGLSYESADAELVEEAQVLLAVPVAELVGPARERTSQAVHRAKAQSEHQLAAVLLLAQSDGYRAAGDSAGALHLAQEGLTLEGLEPRTRERLLDSGVELAVVISELELARQYAVELLELTAQRTASDDPDAQRDLSVALGRLGYVVRELGDLGAARAHYQEALDINRRAAEQLDTPQAQRDLSVTLERLGNLARDLGELGIARAHHQQALDIDRHLAEQLGTPQALTDLAWNLTSLGDVVYDLGDLSTARTHYQQAIDIRQRLAEQLGTPQALTDLAWSLIRLGDVARDLGDLGDARAHYQEVLDINRRLAAQLDTPQAQRDLSVSFERLGDVDRDLGELGMARTHHQQALDIRQRLGAQLDTPQAQRDLSVSFERLGDVDRDLGELGMARTHHQQALDIRQRLAAQLDTPQAQRDLSVSFERLGDVIHDLGDSATAEGHYQQSLDMRRHPAEQLGTAAALRDLRAGLIKIAETEEDLGNADAAAALRAELATVEYQLTALRDDPPDPPDQQSENPS